MSLLNHNSIKASIRNLETQPRQLARKVKEKFEKKFIANIDINPKEHCNAIIMWSENVYEQR